jgi:hypothetical protein
MANKSKSRGRSQRLGSTRGYRVRRRSRTGADPALNVFHMSRILHLLISSFVHFYVILFIFILDCIAVSD